MRIVFMGSPDFSVPILDALLAAGHSVAAVYAQPPRPAGRGQHERPCPVHAFAAARGLAVRTPRSLRDAQAQQAFAELDADVAVVAAYGLILPAPVLAAPRHGCINVHASLLPRWRGAAPIQRAIEAGDAETGVTIMQMEAGLDTGPMLLAESVPIGPAATAADLHDALAALGARLIVAALDRLAAGTLAATPQPEAGVTYARKLTPQDGRLDWTQPAADLVRKIRAFTPWPGAWFTLDGQRIKALAAEAAKGTGAPGTVLDDRLTVACGTGALRLLRVQREGRQAMDAGAFLRGRSVTPGTALE
ncbi:MAG: methionyl-tRNA formyltransferase [Alphaproteobacteria bacterium]